jgi:hypothetical protein
MLGVVILVLPFIVGAFGAAMPFGGFIKGVGIFIIVVGLIHQILKVMV